MEWLIDILAPLAVLVVVGGVAWALVAVDLDDWRE